MRRIRQPRGRRRPASLKSLMAGRWGCHRAHIRELLNECYDLGEGLSSLNCTWFVRHIYREFNEIANDLASECIRTGRGRASPGW